MRQDLLKCDLHDYLEIACLYKFKVELILKNKSKIQGIPITTMVVEKIEYLELNSGDKFQTVALLELSSIRATDKNPHFDVVRF